MPFLVFNGYKNVEAKKGRKSMDLRNWIDFDKKIYAVQVSFLLPLLPQISVCPHFSCLLSILRSLKFLDP